MWVPRNTYQALCERAGKAETLTAANASQATTIQWLLTRVNQLEQERAGLLAAVTKLPQLVPTLRPADPLQAVSTPPIDTSREVAAFFEDVGDDMARALGITHDDDGRVVYTK